MHRSDKFVTMATRTRQEYLKDLAQNYVSPTLVDSGSRLGILMTSAQFHVSVDVVSDSTSSALTAGWASGLQKSGFSNAMGSFLGEPA